MPVILLTRPRDASQGFARQLADALGPVQVMIAPLTGIEWVNEMPDLHGIEALIFTSRQGVEAYRRLGLSKGARAFCVGGSTAQDAIDAGLDAVSADGDADALVALIEASGARGPLVHIRGAESRGNIAGRLNQSGIETKEAILYRQITLPMPPEAQALLQGTAPVIVPLFSPRSAARFTACAPYDAPLFLAAISAGTAEGLRGLGAKALVTAQTPDARAMLQAVTGLKDAATRLEADGDAK